MFTVSGNRINDQSLYFNIYRYIEFIMFTVLLEHLRAFETR